MSAYSPSVFLFTVQTALGLPGSSDTAISDTCRTENRNPGQKRHSMSPLLILLYSTCRRYNTTICTINYTMHNELVCYTWSYTWELQILYFMCITAHHTGLGSRIIYVPARQTDLQSVSEDTKCTAGASATGCVELGRILIRQISYLKAHKYSNNITVVQRLQHTITGPRKYYLHL